MQQYRVGLQASVYITTPVEAESREEATEKALESLPKYPVAAFKADQFPGRLPNPIDPDDIHVSPDWEVILVQDSEGNEVWD